MLASIIGAIIPRSTISKLVGTLVGGAITTGMAWLAVKGFGTCKIVDGAQVCNVFGITSTELIVAATGIVTTLIGGVFTYNAPANMK